jgi:hypothetical protein
MRWIFSEICIVSDGGKFYFAKPCACASEHAFRSLLVF